MAGALARSFRRAVRAPVLRLALGFAAGLSLPRAHALGAVLGRQLYRRPNDLRRVAEVNLRLAYPCWEAARREALLREVLEETGKAMLELGGLWSWERERCLALVREVVGLERLQAARARGRGVVAVSPHIGAWEMAGLFLSAHVPFTALYRPPRIHRLDARVRAARERFGARLVPTDAGGVRALYQALRAGEVVGILPDQDPGTQGAVFAPFFGRPAATMTLLPRLLAKSGAVPLLTYVLRLPAGAGYRMVIEPLPPAVADADPVTAAGTLNAALEDLIRRHPAQYQWGYRRWRTRPPGEPALY